MKIGILGETKIPPDRRVPLTPAQCLEIQSKFPETELVVQPSLLRSFADKEYSEAGIILQEDLSDCNILLGVKEVAIPSLIEDKTYLFFSHTAKEQPYNRKLLQAVLKKRIKLVDYEYLTRRDNVRVVAFGRWAGIVGAYNGLIAYGKKMGLYTLESAQNLRGLDEMKSKLASLKIPGARIVLTGGGRVANGALEIMHAAGIREVAPQSYLNSEFTEAVFCRLDPWHYTRHSTGKAFNFDHFLKNPRDYDNAFIPFALKSDLYIACHFWDPDSPILLSEDDLKNPDLPLKVIADISCDINGPIASTIRASTIADPVYGYDPKTKSEVSDPYGADVISVMAVDNLPGELPRDASADFGRALIDNVFPSLLHKDDEGIIQRATITEEGALTEEFAYLESYANG